MMVRNSEYCHRFSFGGLSVRIEATTRRYNGGEKALGRRLRGGEIINPKINPKMKRQEKVNSPTASE